MALTKVTYSMIEGTPYNVVDFGADITGSNDSSAAIQLAIEAANTAGGGQVYLPSGTYKIVAPIITYKNIALIGESRTETVLSKAGNTLGPNTSNTSPYGGGIVDTYHVDAVIILKHADATWADYVSIKNMSITSANNSVYGLYLPRIGYATIDSVNISYVQNGYFSYGGYLNTLSNMFVDKAITAYKVSLQSDGIGSGTSHIFQTCHSGFDNTVNQPLAAFDIQGLSYSTLINCACDFLTNTDGDIPNVYMFFKCNSVSVIDCAAEAGAARVIGAQTSNNITVQGMFTINMKGSASWPYYDGTIVLVESSMTIINSNFGPTISPNTNLYDIYMTSNSTLNAYESTMPNGGNGIQGVNGTSTTPGTYKLVNGASTTILDLLTDNTTNYPLVSSYSKLYATAAAFDLFVITAPAGVNKVSCSVQMKVTTNTQGTTTTSAAIQDINFIFHKSTSSVHYYNSSVVNSTVASSGSYTAPTFSVDNFGDDNYYVKITTSDVNNYISFTASIDPAGFNTGWKFNYV